jgi:hypothetical protein
MFTWVTTYPLRMALLASLPLAGGFQIHLKHTFLKCSLPATPLLADLPSQPFYTLHNIILKSNFLLYSCRWIKFSQGTDWKFWYCFRLWYLISHILGWKAVHFCVLCITTLLLKPTGLSNAYKIWEAFFIHHIVATEETACSKCPFIALCSYQTMVI